MAGSKLPKAMKKAKAISTARASVLQKYGPGLTTLLDVIHSQITEVYETLNGLRPDYYEAGESYDHLLLWIRAENEGPTFITKTLPRLGDAFDAWMQSIVLAKENGSVIAEFKDPGFQTSNLGYPRFLANVWALILEGLTADEDDPIKLPSSDDTAVTECECSTAPYFGADPQFVLVHLIRQVRTILHSCKKVHYLFTKEQLDKAVVNYLEIEADLPDHADERPWNGFLATMAQDLFSAVTGDWDTLAMKRNLAPKHGPGAVAGGQRDEEKWNFTTLYDTLHTVFPYYDYHFGIRGTVDGVPSRYLCETVGSYREMRREAYPVSRLLFVPKDSRGPRTIACEPCELMWIQQGVAVNLARRIESHWLTKGHVNFTDQSINRKLARIGSKTNWWATIDLSDASDRVSCTLVKFLCRSNAAWDILAATRSHGVRMPDGTVLRLRKFAPMGSALCFPVESLAFWAISVAAVLDQDLREGTMSQHELSSWESCQRASQLVYVYGDDIIVDPSYADSVMAALAHFDLKVNVDKSFVDGPFRESCGIDALKGYDVTPYRIRKQFPAVLSNGVGVQAWLEYASNMSRVFPQTAKLIKAKLEKLCRVTFPVTEESYDFLSLVTQHPFELPAWTHTDWEQNGYRLEWSSTRCYYTTKALKTLTASRMAEYITDTDQLLANLSKRSEEEDCSRVVVRAATKMRKARVSIPYLPYVHVEGSSVS